MSAPQPTVVHHLVRFFLRHVLTEQNNKQQKREEDQLLQQNVVAAQNNLFSPRHEQPIRRLESL